MRVRACTYLPTKAQKREALASLLGVLVTRLLLYKIIGGNIFRPNVITPTEQVTFFVGQVFQHVKHVVVGLDVNVCFLAVRFPGVHITNRNNLAFPHMEATHCVEFKGGDHLMSAAR